MEVVLEEVCTEYAICLIIVRLQAKMAVVSITTVPVEDEVRVGRQFVPVSVDFEPERFELIKVTVFDKYQTADYVAFYVDIEAVNISADLQHEPLKNLRW